ncbi:hypothetical protein PG997_000599 [Apiospora hydei]|uniref:Uncharacterized protein n=1 Tax=Apiospora hydei TaxID=1337664 RepID=A0ABR1XBB5_9PEZI
MASTQSALTNVQQTQIREIWQRQSQSLRGIVLSRMLESAMNVGGKSLSRLYPEYYDDAEFIEKIEATPTSVSIRGSRFRATFELLDMKPGDSHATVAVATSWTFSSEEKAGLEGRGAAVVDDTTISSRIKFTYGSCDPPAQ